MGATGSRTGADAAHAAGRRTRLPVDGGGGRAAGQGRGPDPPAGPGNGSLGAGATSDAGGDGRAGACSRSFAGVWCLLSARSARANSVQDRATQFVFPSRPVLGMLVQETLRLYAPWFVTREAREDVRLGKTVIPGGTQMIFSLGAAPVRRRPPAAAPVPSPFRSAAASVGSDGTRA
ncbi:cytochrome P450 [Streptomyces sp. NPDC058595]|uniref:cytochrome P450 n=1 Tax=Streptomyces sp. NPDC058595 TaxID=3346550 RepID=UPI003663F333